MAHVLGLGPVPPNVRQYNVFKTIFCLFLAKKVQKILNLRNFEKKNIRNFDYFVIKYCHPGSFLAQSFPYVSGIISKLDFNIKIIANGPLFMHF